MKKYALFIYFMLIAGLLTGYGQVSPTGLKLDETHLALFTGTTVVSDATADGGQAIFRPASAVSTYMWYGPYTHLQGGNYLVQLRLKVASNASSATLLNFDVVSSSGATTYTAFSIAPNMFRNSNEWQLFTMPVQVPDNVTDYELRGANFNGGITDLSLDYIMVLPGDLRGFYSNEFTVTGTGNVGIGTQNLNGYKLAVNGTVHAKQVNVDLSNWADYVFSAEYSLKPLTKVRAYIDKNHHLPDIPSEQDMIKNGLNVGEMNKLLTKKVEELTLYLIEQDKLRKEQGIINQKQQNQIDLLIKEVARLSKTRKLKK